MIYTPWGIILVMAIETVTLDNFNSITASDGIVFLDCWADWCPPCRAFKPVFEAAAEEHTDISFGSLDTQNERVLASQLGISSIPTIMAFRDGILVFSQPGALQAKGFSQLIDAVRNLDMDEVRKSLEEQENSPQP